MQQNPARSVSIAALISLVVFFAAGPALGGALQSQVGLGTADDFAVLAGQEVTNSGTTEITGSVGVSPGTSITGFGTVTVNDGSIHNNDGVAAGAQSDLTTAYNDAAGRTPENTIAVELGGQTLTEGVYVSGATNFEINGELTLDAENNPDAVFIFKMSDSSLVTFSASSVNLINGAQACNVFWQVGSDATLGTNSSFIGNILALTSISLNTGATVEGRVLARNGTVSLLANTIERATCLPEGGVGTGGGSTSGAQNMILLLGGISLLAVAAGVFEVRRRLQDRRSG